MKLTVRYSHGNCYIDGTVCCDNSSIQCSVGQLCNACPSGQTCIANGCSGDSSSASPITTTAEPTNTQMTTATTTTVESSTTAAPVGPTVVPTTGTFSNIGCYADDGADRVLNNGSSTDYSSTGMTVEKCTALASRYQYAGVEYYGQVTRILAI